MRNLLLGACAVTCLLSTAGIAQAAHTDATPALHRGAAAAAVPQGDTPRRYILRLQDAPAATYTGGVAGYGATDPHARGERTLDVSAAASYAAYLDEKQSTVLSSAAKLLGRTLLVRYRYHLAFNGMSLELTPAEAARLAALPGVLSVTEVRHFAPSSGVSTPASSGDTNASRAWVDAPAAWQLPTITDPGAAAADNEGEGIVLADLDTGVNHANASFAATGGLDGFTAVDTGGLRFGVCDPSNTAQHNKEPAFFGCNDKLIGAYTYTKGSADPNSPEDSEGHGSHTASTVVGDFVSVPVNGVNTPLSGMAPHASVIAYDVCDPTNLCTEDDSVAAVEQAIKDQAKLKANWGAGFKGMVLNYSIGGSDTPYDDPVEQAFLSAVEAGIYVSTAGGNGGPANVISNDPTNAPVYVVQHLGPWVATLAASTHDGSFSSNKLENFAGGDAGTMPHAALAGDGNTAGFGPQPLVYTGDGSFDGDLAACGSEPSGEACVSAGSAAANAQQCLFPFMPGTFTASEIVVCDRGTNPLVDKAYNVQQGGAAGMVIATTSTSSQDMVVEPYVIPATLLDQRDGNKLRAWLSASSGSATPPSADLSGASLTIDRGQADQIAGFSSRGPVGTAYDSLIKPDMAAPGVSVLAAVSDPQYTHGCSACSAAPESYDFYDGTSMAAPHDTAAAALLMQAHPAWSVSEIKSALMLTAVTAANGSSPGVSDQCASLDSGNNCIASKALPSPQVRGSGRLDVDAALRAGLMLDESGSAYAAADPAKGGDLAALNLASLGDAACAGTCTWTRTLTSTFSSASVTYHVSVSGLSGGLSASVSPTSFTLAPHGTQVITVQANATKVAASDWAFGSVVLTPSGTGDGGAAIPAMRMPIAVESTGVTSGSGAGSGKSGGGGDLGLFGLSTLLLAWRRRLNRQDI